MSDFVKEFDALTPNDWALAGGKGSTLARLLQLGYPVPPGFVILAAAFGAAGELSPDARQQIVAHLQRLRGDTADAPVAVRSSALAEDSAQTSFAGEFESVLNVQTDAEFWAALDRVYRSAQTERVRAYSAAHGVDVAHRIAVVVQHMVPAELAGVLFTADPVSGSYGAMLGNYVHGLGEVLVSGEADAEQFTLTRPKGTYAGPAALRPHAKELFRIATKLEKTLDGPQDIEWAVAQGQLYILQARPITTLSLGNLDEYAINESLVEEALWVNTNVAEAVPDVFSPLTWSIIRGIDNELNFIPGYYVWSGNICGHVYSNISRRVSAAHAMTGMSTERIVGLLGDLFGRSLDRVQMPLYPFTRGEVVRKFAPGIGRVIGKTLTGYLTLNKFLRENPARCRAFTTRIREISSKAELLHFWQQELEPYLYKAWWAHTAGGSRIVNTMVLARRLTKLVGAEDANTLLSNLRNGSELASLGPVTGIAKVRRGEMSRADYLAQYGHRGPHEFELSIPHPAEDPTWLEAQLADDATTALDADGLLARQEAAFEAAKVRFIQQHPRRAKWLETKLKQVAQGAQLRERARSEFTRTFRVVRAYALRAGELTGLGNDIFFLYSAEIAALLGGDDSATQHIPARKANYTYYQSLPPLPSVIRGRFRPEEWLKDPNRRLDVYDPTLPLESASQAELRGIPGAAGRVEGTVRILQRPEEGDSLRPGEILVAATTNVGWTPLFPKAAAIITDIGAPLSHAAIVARELGIPAVVGCGVATTQLKTGDRVLVDGGQGVVQILREQRAEP
ncbi:MAG: PEP/pyruvate-binding domain-containing protein [Caldilineaceae bacterium]